MRRDLISGYEYNLIIFFYLGISCSSSLVLKPARIFAKMKSEARFASYRVSSADFVETFKSQSWIFKQGPRRVSDFTIRHPFDSNLAD